MDLSEELVEYIESGVSISVASCDARGRPECIRGLGALVSADRRSVTVLLNGAIAARMRDNLAENDKVAMVLARIADHRSIQLKGRATALRDASEQEVAMQERYLAAYGEQLSLVGMPRAILRRVRRTPCLALDIELGTSFLQTPGPEAGRRLEP